MSVMEKANSIKEIVSLLTDVIPKIIGLIVEVVATLKEIKTV